MAWGLSMWKAVLLIGLVAVVLIVAGLVVAYDSPGPLAEDTIVTIPKGAGFRSIIAQLEHEGVVYHRALIAAPALLHKQQAAFKPGEYAFEAAVSPKTVLARLVSGDIVVHKLTIPEGLTSKQIIALMDAEEHLTGQVEQVPAEGSLLPETYHFERGESRQAVVLRMQQAMQKVMQELWPDRQPGLPFETMEDAVTLASIVEEEARLARERPHIASVYINRLHKGMKLQADPTTIYAIELAEGQPMGRPLWLSDLKRDLPHNTYIHAGLPPTPIANPGKASIHAALNPLASEDLFFVATGDGGHYFAKTFAEHQRNIEKYRAER